MRFKILSATFPPDHCGVGDHGARLAEALVHAGHEVSVWTRQQSPVSIPGVRCMPWPEVENGKIAGSDAREKADAVLVQYVPQLVFHPPWKVRGSFLRLLAAIKATYSAPLAGLVHEVRYPIHFDLRGIAYGIPHYFHFRELLKTLDLALFSTEPMADEWRARMPEFNSRLSWLPVGANVLPNRENPPRRAFDGRSVSLVHFGGRHPTHLLGHIARTAADLHKALGGPKVRLIYAGLKRDQIDDLLALAEGVTVEAPGYLEMHEISRLLSESDAMLAPFMDGISTRRGSVMAGLAHGLPVFTTRAWSSGRAVPWEDFLSVSADTTVESFSRVVQQAFSDSAGLGHLAQRGARYYAEHFSWESIVKKLVSGLERAG